MEEQHIIEDTRKDHSETAAVVDGLLKNIGGENYVRDLAISVAHFCFRNGPVEDMHASGKLDDPDMMVLNKYMVDYLGMFFLLLGLADVDSLNKLLLFHKLCGLDWDAPDLLKRLSENHISAERIKSLARNRKRTVVDDDRSSGPSRMYERMSRTHDPDEDLPVCPICGSNVLIRDCRTNLFAALNYNPKIGSNKALAQEAQVPIQLVTDMQFVDRVKNPNPKQRERMEKVAEALRMPLDYVIAFNPFTSTVKCDDCKTSAPWAVWCTREAKV